MLHRKRGTFRCFWPANNQKSWHKFAYLIWFISTSKGITKNILIRVNPTVPRASFMSDGQQLEFKIDRVLRSPFYIVNEWKVRRILSCYLVCFLLVVVLSVENTIVLEVLRLLSSLSFREVIKPQKRIRRAISRIQGSSWWPCIPSVSISGPVLESPGTCSLN